MMIRRACSEGEARRGEKDTEPEATQTDDNAYRTSGCKNDGSHAEASRRETRRHITWVVLKGGGEGATCTWGGRHEQIGR
eukprot:15478824-Alexandrium_andersonii.AAC.1